MSYQIEQIALETAAYRVGDTPATIDWLLTDSRSLSFPEATLFFALTTKRNSGAHYIKELYQRGVRNFVVARNDYAEVEALNLHDTNILLVPDTLLALQKLAQTHRKQFQIPVIGITGSNGKTVVKEWLHQLLSPDRIIVRSPRSFNSQIGVPLSVWQLHHDAELAIFEAGISQPGEMEPLRDIIQPTIGVLTNIGSAHQENFFSRQEKCMEKLTLFRDSDVLIYNGDDEFINNCVNNSVLATRSMAWSRKDADRPLFISKMVKIDEDHTEVSYRYLDMVNKFTLPFTDNASIENSLHCLAVCCYLMLSPEQISVRMSRLEPVAMRLEVKEGRNDCLLINDSYNSDLTSLDLALDFLYRRSQDKQLKRTLILSDILETGQKARILYRQVEQLVKSKGIQRIIGVGEEISSCADEFNMEKMFYPSTAALLKAINELKLTLDHEIILIKGARKFGFDELTEAIEKKVHETILEVNLGALVKNFNYYRSLLKPETKMVCMVKASAYGAGSIEVARTLQEHHVDYLAVAVADEGAELRKAGITASILIMNPEMTAFKTMFDYKLEPEVYSFHWLEALIDAAEKEGITNYPIHIKLDTGMHRLGFSPLEIPALIRRLKNQNALIARSVFSHFVGSDAEQFDAFTRQQIETFLKASGELQAAFPHKILRHICNSAGIERFPGIQLDMVRLGLGLYGINPITNAVMHNVCTLKTTILQIHDVPADETVGYSRKGHLSRPSRIAAIPIGYADGLNRHLGNGHCYCLVNGKKAPYVGNICMDVCMIDVTDIDCKDGDKVEIFGDNLPVTVLSDVLETIPYEVLTSVSNRVKRIYFQD